MSPHDNMDGLDLYRQMLRVRRVEEAIAKHYPEQEMRCPTHLCIGQEAVPAGVMAHLHRADLIFSGHRSHGHYLAKGGDLKAMIAELYGRDTGCARGRGGSQHLIDLDAGFVASAPILAGTVPIAVGAAWAIKERGLDQISVVFFGDGATEEGSFHESMNYASVHGLPVVFVCENNLYSVHSGMAVRQPKSRSVADIGAGSAVPAVTVDGNDVFAVWRHAGEAIERARGGGGPTLLEFMTYRWLEHCGPLGDDDLGYRPAAEVAAWRERCPLVHAEKALGESGLTDDLRAAMEAEISKEIDDAFAFAKASPFPDAATFDAFTYPDEDRGND
ncbi:MAG: thiamine pyrophosphate-dependent dehydrogenase E1 component subunit alpha [Rhodospirillales bacterium]